MTPYTFSIKVDTIPPVAKRQQHALVLLADRNHHFLLGRKEVYPPGIFRLIGGGVEAGETFQQAAIRETYEELSVALQPEKIKELAEVIFRITDKDNVAYTFTTHVFFAEVGEQKILPSEELSAVMPFDEYALSELIQSFQMLPKDIDPLVKFSWHDYGKIYGPIHQIALENFRKLHPTTVSHHTF